MHGAAECVQALYFGYDRQAFFLRIDLNPTFLSERDEFEVRINECGRAPVRIHARISKRQVDHVEFYKGEELSEAPMANGHLEAAIARIFELKISQGLLDLELHDRAKLQVSLWVDELPVQIIPQEGWLDVELTDDF